MKQTFVLAVGLMCLAACATESKNVAATGETAHAQPAQTAEAPAPTTSTGTRQDTASDPTDPGASSQAKGEKPAPAAETAKASRTDGRTAQPAAPVEVTCTPRDDAVHLAIKFLGDARNVDVDVWGTDGLEVTGDAHPVRARVFQRGATLALEVPFKAPDHVRTYLAVQISGTFGDRQLGTVRACTIHPEYPDQDNQDADIRVDDQGRKIRVVHPD